MNPLPPGPLLNAEVGTNDPQRRAFGPTGPRRGFGVISRYGLDEEDDDEVTESNASRVFAQQTAA